MSAMSRSGGGRSRSRIRQDADDGRDVDKASDAVEADSTGAEDADFDIGAEEARLVGEFEREYEFTDSDVDQDGWDSSGFVARRRIRFEDVRDEYSALWSEMAIKQSRVGAADRIVARTVRHKDRYRTVQDLTKVPWYVIAVIHSLEAEGRFSRHLHNGDSLTARTVHVPAGRPKSGSPPFTWEESAIDALEYDGFTRNADWSVEKIAYLFEDFNGWGYRLYHPEVKSPYLWSFSNHYSRGKYVADRKWSPDAVSEQCGSMVILRRLEAGGHVRLQRARSGEQLVSAHGVPFPHEARTDASEFDAGFVDGLETNVDEPGMEIGTGEEDNGHGSVSDFELGEASAPLTARDAPRPVPPRDPVPFAQSRVPPNMRRWPVDSKHPARLLVSYETIDGRIIGRASRRFLAERDDGGRLHVAIDLFAYHQDLVVACEDGQIVNFHQFYKSDAGEMTFALLVQHPDFVLNYGEVKGTAPREFGWRIGSRIRVGQPIARVSTTSMLHVETYVSGTTTSQRWYPGQPKPRALLNPTAYLLGLT